MQCDIRRLSLLHNKIHENFGNFVGNLRLTVCERIMRQLIIIIIIIIQHLYSAIMSYADTEALK